MDIVSADLLGSGVSALHKAVAVADNCGDSHAAQEAQLLVAVIDSGITGQVACLLLFIGDQSGVGGGSLVVQVAGGNVQSQELHIGVLLLSLGDGFAEQVAGDDDGLGTVVDSVVHLLQTGGVGVLARTVVVGVQAVCRAEVLHALPGVLVEGLVIDVADVGNKGDIGLAAGGGSGSLRGSLRRGARGGAGGRTAAGSQRERHAGSHYKSEKLFHGFDLLRLFSIAQQGGSLPLCFQYTAFALLIQ